MSGDGKFAANSGKGPKKRGKDDEPMKYDSADMNDKEIIAEQRDKIKDLTEANLILHNSIRTSRTILLVSGALVLAIAVVFNLVASAIQTNNADERVDEIRKRLNNNADERVDEIRKRHEKNAKEIDDLHKKNNQEIERIFRKQTDDVWEIVRQRTKERDDAVERVKELEKKKK